jgi:hypothetical protein
MKLLGKETLWTKVQFYLLYPFWLATDKDKRKPVDKFRYGLISHKHEYDYSKPEYEKGIKLYRCKHYGCYAADAPEAIREMLNTVEEIKDMKKQLEKLKSAQKKPRHRSNRNQNLS